MRSKLIIVGWLLSLCLMATNSPELGTTALALFVITSLLMDKYSKDVKSDVNKMEKWIDRVLTRNK